MQRPKRDFWHALEGMRGLAAIASVWQSLMEDDFEQFKPFLEPSPNSSNWFRCPRCACSHEVFHDDDGSIVAACRCKPRQCSDLQLTAADIAVWELNRGKLSREIARAFGLQSRTTQLGPHETWQIGSWSTDAVPATLTIQWDPQQFRLAVASLVARLRRPFILFAPTSAQTDAQVLEYLAGCGAQLFPLDANLTLTPNGNFQPRILPGELFARFRPDAKEPLPEDDARRVFVIIEKLDRESRRKSPSVVTVFRLYCREALSLRDTAERCHCSPSTVMERLNVIRKETGLSPAILRTLSPHIEKIREEMADSRASRISGNAEFGGDNASEPDR